MECWLDCFMVERPSSAIAPQERSRAASSVRHSSSRATAGSIHHPASTIQHPPSSIKHQASSIKHPASSIKHPPSSINSIPLQHPLMQALHPERNGCDPYPQQGPADDGRIKHHTHGIVQVLRAEGRVAAVSGVKAVRGPPRGSGSKVSGCSSVAGGGSRTSSSQRRASPTRQRPGSELGARS